MTRDLPLPLPLPVPEEDRLLFSLSSLFVFAVEFTCMLLLIPVGDFLSPTVTEAEAGGGGEGKGDFGGRVEGMSSSSTTGICLAEEE